MSLRRGVADSGWPCLLRRPVKHSPGGGEARWDPELGCAAMAVSTRGSAGPLNPTRWLVIHRELKLPRSESKEIRRCSRVARDQGRNNNRSPLPYCGSCQGWRGRGEGAASRPTAARPGAAARWPSGRDPAPRGCVIPPPPGVGVDDRTKAPPRPFCQRRVVSHRQGRRIVSAVKL